METIKIAVCDDEKVFRKINEDYILTAFQKLGKPVEIKAFDSGEILLKQLKTVKPDIIFSDIQMDGIDGIEMAKLIRRVDNNIIIVFVSGHPQLVFDSIEARPYNFLSKPVTQGKIDEVCNKIIKELEDREAKDNEFLDIKIKDTVSKVNLKDIIHIESHLKKIHIVLTNGDIWLNDKIDNLERQLVGKGFIRCHRCHIVSKDKISKMTDNSLAMENDRLVPIAKSKKEEVRQVFFEKLMQN